MTVYEPVIGLEVHVELKTATKMFCSSPNAFGGEPNTNVCPVCLGLPGTLPVINRAAVECAVRFGTAVGSTIGRAIFHRKNYFYPDMPKDFQISQYDEPICLGGAITAVGDDGEPFTIRLTRAHLEEDTGKLVHRGGGGRIHDAAYSLIDYNRAGVPLLEIVSEPEIRSPEQAAAYVKELRAICELLGVSDVKMEEGSLRVDANVSVRPVGTEPLGTKVEIKNMNSIRSLQRAVQFEIDRQVTALETGQRIIQETRHWNEDDGTTHGMRTKEEAFDYRYFPEPDLVPIAPDPAWVAEIAALVPSELPAARVRRLVAETAISAELASAVVYTKGLGEWVDAEVAAGADARNAYVWASQEVLAHLNESGGDVAALVASGALAPGTFVELSRLVADATLSSKLARQVLVEVLRTGQTPGAVVAAQGLAQISDSGELEAIVAEVVAANPDAVAKFRDGNDKILGFLVGQVMKQTKGKANPGTVNDVLRAALGGA